MVHKKQCHRWLIQDLLTDIKCTKASTIIHKHRGDSGVCSKQHF